MFSSCERRERCETMSELPVLRNTCIEIICNKTQNIVRYEILAAVDAYLKWHVKIICSTPYLRMKDLTREQHVMPRWRAITAPRYHSIVGVALFAIGNILMGWMFVCCCDHSVQCFGTAINNLRVGEPRASIRCPVSVPAICQWRAGTTFAQYYPPQQHIQRGQ